MTKDEKNHIGVGMKEELSGKMVEILTSIQNASGKASDFAIEQLPDIAQSYVMYGRVQSIVMILLQFIFFVVFVFMARWLVKNPWEGEFGEERGLTNSFCIILCIAFAIFLLLCFSSGVSNFLLVWLAPKVWLLKELASMVK